MGVVFPYLNMIYPADWQSSAIARMAFSERLCRNRGIVCGQALMALADTSNAPDDKRRVPTEPDLQCG
jgi:hypothetical protein